MTLRRYNGSTRTAAACCSLSDMLDTANAVVASPLLTAIDAATYLRIDVRTLANWRAAGRGPSYIRVGRRPFYTREALDSWLRAHSFVHSAAERAHRASMLA